MVGPESTVLQRRYDVTAVILAGGASSRMGFDKAQLMWRGRAFVEHLAEQLRAQCRDIAINSNAPAADFASLHVPLLRDPFAERRGPLAGVLAALEYSTTEITLVVPCDTPLLAPTLVERLVRGLDEPGARIAYAVHGGDRHYLYAALRTDLGNSLRRFLAGDNFAVRRWYESECAVAVHFEADTRHFLNINTPADLETLPR